MGLKRRNEPSGRGGWKDTREGLNRRRDSALRCPPLRSGYRDPDEKQTDAPVRGGRRERE